MDLDINANRVLLIIRYIRDCSDVQDTLDERFDDLHAINVKVSVQFANY